MKVLKLTLLTMTLALAAGGARADEPGPWRVMPIRSHAELEAGLIGGEAEQHPQGIARSASHPDVIYLSHDVGLVWRSDDNGRTWDHVLGEGMHARMGQSVAVDPVDPDVVLAVMDNAWDYFGRDHTGIYRSTNGGRSWELTLKTQTQHQRTHQENLAHAAGEVDADGARLWYAAFATNGLYRSIDAGREWHRRSELDDHERVYGVAVHPGDADRLWLASSEGLFASRDGGGTLERVDVLPDGGVGSVRINPDDPAQLDVAVIGEGLYRSEDGGASFEQVLAFDAMYVFVHADRQVLYLVGQRGSGTRVSHDGGRTWHEPRMVPAAGLGRDRGSWKFDFDGPHSAVLPDPRDATSAVGYSRATLWRTADGGRTFEDSSTLWTGYAWGWYTSAVAFDVADPDRFAFFLYDVGMVLTDNGGMSFSRGSIPWAWRRDGLVDHSGMYAGDIRPEPGSDVILAAGGIYWNSRLMRTEDGGGEWNLLSERDDSDRYLYVAFHRDELDIVYAHRDRSTDGGRTFSRIASLQAYDAFIVGMAPTRPDTVYAIDGDRKSVLRSDDRGETWRVYVAVDWQLAPFDPKPTFLVDPTNEDRIYTVDRRGDLAVYDGESWRSLDVLKHAGTSGGRNFIRAVAVDPRHPDVIYVGTHSPGRPFIFRSTDGGETWQDISGNLGRLGIGGLAVHPLTGDVFVGGIAGTRVLAPPYDSPRSIYGRLPDDWRMYEF